MSGSAFWVAVLAYGVSGMALGGALYALPRWRALAVVQVATPLVSLLMAVPALALAAVDAEIQPGDASYSVLAFRGFVFLSVAVVHAPPVVWAIVCLWGRIVDRLTGAPEGGRESTTRPRTAREERERVGQLLARLARRPLDTRTREELAESYRELGFVDAAIGEYRRAADCLERGHEQSRLLYKAAWLQVELQAEVPKAIPTLRRIVRLYPRSYFAAYARRVISHFEAHRQVGRYSGERDPTAREGEHPAGD